MLEDMVKDYAAYIELDMSCGFQTVQDVIDNMLTRLEELASVLQMIKLKNGDCGLAVSEDISKHRSEISTLSRKVSTISEVVSKLHSNIDVLEKQVEKAEIDFGIIKDNKLKSFLRPLQLLKINKDISPAMKSVSTHTDKVPFESILDNFEMRNNFQ